MKLDVHFVGACGLDGLVELDGVAVDIDTSLLELLVDVHIGDRTERFAGCACLESEDGLQLLDFSGNFFSFVELFGLTLGASCGEVIEVLFVCFGCLISLALWDEVVTGEAGFNFNNVSFGAEVVDFGAENDFCSGHGKKVEGRRV